MEPSKEQVTNAQNEDTISGKRLVSLLSSYVGLSIRYVSRQAARIRWLVRQYGPSVQTTYPASAPVSGAFG